jgi:tetratricopeptide (TPR) repeat protein
MRRSLLLIWILGVGAAADWIDNPGLAADPPDIIQLLEQRRCEECKLEDADLVHADLRDARLRRVRLQRANLSGAQLDGADLRQADLSFTSLTGASLRGANLQGAILIGTDLRGSDLTGASLDPGSLSRSHWQQAKGIPARLHNYSELHNAGIHAALEGNYPEAEHWFSSAIKRMPDAAISWVARGLSRLELGKPEEAASDFRYAGTIYSAVGDQEQAEALIKASQQILEPAPRAKAGNGLGSKLISGAMAALATLGPLALKAMSPTPF